MAILYSCESGWFVSHDKLVESWFGDCDFPEVAQPSAMKLKDALFDIRTPFQMDSAAQKQAAMLSASDGSLPSSKAAQRRRRRQPREDDVPLTDFVQPGSWIKRAACEIVSAAVARGHLDARPATQQELAGNNAAAREAAASLASCVLRDSEAPVCVGGPMTRRATLVRTFLVPAGARAQLGDIRQLAAFLTGSYDFILVDPPWENKSAKRKRSYATLSRDELLLALPLSRLACPEGCLVAVWCTFNAAHLDFVVRRLLPSWGLPYLTTWYWVKVTKHGEPVRPFHCPHKKPVELLVFGGSAVEALPRDQVLVSVPSSVHSHKPPLSELIKPFVKTSAKCLELFARYLVPGWTSVGNEVLKLQHLALYKPVSS
uniref:DNA N6-adenine methyltransferase n=1 Tax=Ixodes ricinus TaxID=34613 RepID=A0A4D6V127_IXORI|nr:DNA N6-adenine methyltransferase [Ixodes ricinus]